MEITANALQTVNANSNVVFTNTAVAGNCSMIHREGSGLITLRGITSANQRKARFRILFGGNIAVPTGGTPGAISLAVAINGEPVETTTMISTPTAVEQFNNISCSLFLDVIGGCCTQVSVENTSTQAISLQNANLIIERVA